MVAIGWSIVWLVFVLAGQANLDTHADGYGHAGLWIGFTLVAVSVALRIGDIVVAKQIPPARSTGRAPVVTPAPAVYS